MQYILACLSHNPRIVSRAFNADDIDVLRLVFALQRNNMLPSLDFQNNTKSGIILHESNNEHENNIPQLFLEEHLSCDIGYYDDETDYSVGKEQLIPNLLNTRGLREIYHLSLDFKNRIDRLVVLNNNLDLAIARKEAADIKKDKKK